MRRIVLLCWAGFLLAAAVAQAAVKNDGSTPAPANIIHLVTHVPSVALDRVGAGTIPGPTVSKLQGAPLTDGGKPELLNVDLAWCPHCAADSWALAIALSRFGSLSRLRVLDTGTIFCTKFHAHPCFPHTPGLSFFSARFHSPYLSFVDVVLQSTTGSRVKSLTPAEGRALNVFDANGIVPAVDAGGVYGFVNSGYSPGQLAHKTWRQVARALARPHTAIARSIDALANLFTAAICKATGGRPAGVCNSAGVRAAAAARLH